MEQDDVGLFSAIDVPSAGCGCDGEQCASSGKSFLMSVVKTYRADQGDDEFEQVTQDAPRVTPCFNKGDTLNLIKPGAVDDYAMGSTDFDLRHTYALPSIHGVLGGAGSQICFVNGRDVRVRAGGGDLPAILLSVTINVSTSGLKECALTLVMPSSTSSLSSGSICLWASSSEPSKMGPFDRVREIRTARSLSCGG